MRIDIHTKSQDLLTLLANAIHDREQKVSPHPFCFYSAELQKANLWLENFMEEVKKECVCLE